MWTFCDLPGFFFKQYARKKVEMSGYFLAGFGAFKSLWSDLMVLAPFSDFLFCAINSVVMHQVVP